MPSPSRSRSRSRSPGDRDVAKSRSRSPLNRDVDQTNNKLFVGNLSYDTSERQLEEIFAKFGKVTESRLAVDKFNGRPKGFAFITMEDPRDAADAERDLAGYEIDGRRIRVEISHGKGPSRRRDDRGYRGGDHDRDRRDYGRDRDRGWERRDRSRDRGRDRRDRSRDRRDRRRSRSTSRHRR